MGQLQNTITIELSEDTKKFIKTVSENHNVLQVNAKDGCVIVCSYDGLMPYKTAKKTGEILQETFPFASRILILEEGMQLSVVNTNQIDTRCCCDAKVEFVNKNGVPTGCPPTM